MERYRPLACRAAQLILSDPAEAEDAAQEGFLKAYGALASFRIGEPFRPWLLRIVANDARNRRRAASARAGLAARAVALTPRDDGEPSPETASLEAERRRALIGAFGSLREDDRSILAHRYVMDLSEAEMADILGLKRGTVKSRLSRALGRLRERYLAVAVAAAIAAAAALLALFPNARAVVADRLGLHGLAIIRVVTPSTPSPIPTRSIANLGRAVTLSTAQGQVGFLIRQPSSPGFTTPDGVYLISLNAETEVTLSYHPQASPMVADASAGVLVTELLAQVDRNIVAKGIGQGSTLEELTVNGGRGYWIAGQPHGIFIIAADGSMVPDSLRLAGNTLVWEQGALLLRIEGISSKEDALSLAASIK